MTPSRRVTLALLGTAAALSGCASEPKAVFDKDAVLRLDVTEYRITPQNLRITATGPMTRVVIVATNTGKLAHTVKVERMEGEPDPDDEGVTTDTPALTVMDATGKKAAGVGYLPPGARDIGPEFFLAPGEYKLTDSIGNHENLGAYGKLTVDPPK